MDIDYHLERRLSILDSNLQRRYKDCLLTSDAMLTRYQSTFHQYTDHTILHTMNVTNFCNHLIGDQVECLTADDIYVLLMGCLFHDVGMGISKEDYELFKPRLKNPSPSQEFAEVIRSSHNELSAMYLEKYWKLLDIPNESIRWEKDVAYASRILQLSFVFPTSWTLQVTAILVLYMI